MSSLIAFLGKNQFIIGTDTLVHSRIEGKNVPINFFSKTFYLPQLKCCFAGQGSGEVINQFFIFVQQKVIAKDILSLITQAKEHFKYDNQEIIENENLATLFLFGLNDNSINLECYKLKIYKSKSNTIEPIELGLLHKPPIENIENIVSQNSGLNIEDLIIRLMQEQKNQDDLKLANERAVIGGQIQITTMIYDVDSKDLIFQIKVFNAFDDFNKLYFRMLNNT
jgi:hypothetical protein